MKIKVYSKFKRPETIPVVSGKKIYKWLYVNSKKEICEDKLDIYQRTQSHRNSTDYKKAIANGELNINDRGIYADVTNFDNGYTDVGNYLDKLVSDIMSNTQNETKSNSITENDKNTDTGGEVTEKIQEIEGATE